MTEWGWYTIVNGSVITEVHKTEELARCYAQRECVRKGLPVQIARKIGIYSPEAKYTPVTEE